MLRIVGVQRHFDPQREFVLLQNQCGLKTNLKGHVLADGEAMEDRAGRMYVFSHDEMIPSSCFVLLMTGRGEAGWRKSADGSPVYYVHWNQDAPVWAHASETIHLLNIVHTRRPLGDAVPAVH